MMIIPRFQNMVKFILSAKKKKSKLHGKVSISILKVDDSNTQLQNS